MGGWASDARRPVALVVLVASAGGLDALSTVVGDLSAEFPAAIVVHTVQQHRRWRNRASKASSVVPSVKFP
ncbi:hypothetical protein H7K35_21335 [Mycobacterium seoulense]|nr:hypothetical protein [Mycobacterium seoulense]